MNKNAAKNRIIRVPAALAAALVMALVLAVPVMAGGNATADHGYSSTQTLPKQTKPTLTPPAVASATGGGQQLPFTGVDVAVLVAGGAVLGAIGFGMRRAGSRRS